MGLGQSIVIVNQFNVKMPGGTGSLGTSTPGYYVERYASRADATEVVAPVMPDFPRSYVDEYMARAKATEQMEASPVTSAVEIPYLKETFHRMRGLGGRAFGPKNPSLSHDDLKAKSQAAQSAFEEGRTIIMPIISFEEEYLREQGIIDEDFFCRKRGDYRGHIDQMKLRLAINHGMERLARSFDDLDWVGAIQVDTEHVHCHLIAWDKGEGNVLKNGQQRGKLSQYEMSQLRRGIDLSLDSGREIQHLSASVTSDRANVRSLVKRFTCDIIRDTGTPQFLIACLPPDRRLWRISATEPEMRKANAVVREYVSTILSQSPEWVETQRSISEYAVRRATKEGLSNAAVRQLEVNGRERVVTECCDAVYELLRSLPEQEMDTATPLLNVMSTAYEDLRDMLATGDQMAEFGFRLRTFSTRLNYHKKEFKEYRRLCDEWDRAKEMGQASSDSEAMRDFYQSEMDYHAMLMSKYQHFLAFLPDDSDTEEELEELERIGRSRDRLGQMLEDPSFSRFSRAGADAYARRVYAQRDGHLMQSAPQVLQSRYERMSDVYFKRLRALNTTLQTVQRRVVQDRKPAQDGETQGEFFLRKELHSAYDFEDVKALDLHHMSYDFAYDIDISKPNIDIFVDTARWRREALDAAEEYLSRTKQSSYYQWLPRGDIELMNEVADTLEAQGRLVTSRIDGGGKDVPSHKTLSLDRADDLTPELSTLIHTTVASAVSTMERETARLTPASQRQAQSEPELGA